MVGGSGAAGLRSISLRLIFLCRCFIHIFSSLSPSSNTIAETITHTISFFPHSPWIRAAFERETVSTKFKRGRLWAILPEYYIIVPQWSFIVTLTQQREREMLEREEGAFLLIRFTFRGRIVLHSTRFVSQSPFHSSTSWIIDFQGDTTRGLTLLKITVGSILGRRASLQRGNKDRLLLLLLSLFPLFAEKYAVASTSEFHREGYRLCYKFLISR